MSDLQEIIDRQNKIIDRQVKVIEGLQAKCYRLTLSNNTLLKMIGDASTMLFDKWDKENGQ